MNIKEIPKEGKKINIRKNNAWFMYMVGNSDVEVESLSEDLTSNLDIHLRQTKSIVIEGTVHADVVLRCVKCLTLFHKIIDTNFSVVLEPYDNSAPVKHAIAKTELDEEFYMNDEFDPEAVVFEQIMLSLPCTQYANQIVKGYACIVG